MNPKGCRDTKIQRYKLQMPNESEKVPTAKYSYLQFYEPAEKVKTGCEEGNTIQLDTVGGQDAGVKDMPQIRQTTWWAGWWWVGLGLGGRLRGPTKVNGRRQSASEKFARKK